MLYLLTSNPPKYEPFADLLAQLQITLRVPDFELPELQDGGFSRRARREKRGWPAKHWASRAWWTTAACCWMPIPAFPDRLRAAFASSWARPAWNGCLAGTTQSGADGLPFGLLG